MHDSTGRRGKYHKRLDGHKLPIKSFRFASIDSISIVAHWVEAGESLSVACAVQYIIRIINGMRKCGNR